MWYIEIFVYYSPEFDATFLEKKKTYLLMQHDVSMGRQNTSQRKKKLLLWGRQI